MTTFIKNAKKRMLEMALETFAEYQENYKNNTLEVRLKK